MKFTLRFLISSVLLCGLLDSLPMQVIRLRLFVIMALNKNPLITFMVNSKCFSLPLSFLCVVPLASFHEVFTLHFPMGTWDPNWKLCAFPRQVRSLHYCILTLVLSVSSFSFLFLYNQFPTDHPILQGLTHTPGLPFLIKLFLFKNSRHSSTQLISHTIWGVLWLSLPLNLEILTQH